MEEVVSEVASPGQSSRYSGSKLKGAPAERLALRIRSRHRSLLGNSPS